MKRYSAWLIPVMMIGACRRAQPAAAPTTIPSQRPATMTAAAVPTTQTIGPTFMLVGDESVEFPPARLVVKQPGEKISALLFSVDPEAAIKPEYRGNSFYFNLSELSLDDPASINGAVWSYHAPDSERQDGNDGLMIGGRQTQLQPFDVQLLVEGDTSPVHIKLTATFLKYSGSDDQKTGERVNVQAQFDAELKK